MVRVCVVFMIYLLWWFMISLYLLMFGGFLFVIVCWLLLRIGSIFFGFMKMMNLSWLKNFIIWLMIFMKWRILFIVVLWKGIEIWCVYVIRMLLRFGRRKWLSIMGINDLEMFFFGNSEVNLCYGLGFGVI